MIIIDWYVSEASKNPIFVQKNVTFSIAVAKNLKPFKRTCWFAARNITGNYYYLSNCFL